MKPTQKQMFYRTHQAIADCNALFMEMVRDGMTRSDLEKLIARRPGLWGRFSGFLNTLPH